MCDSGGWFLLPLHALLAYFALLSFSFHFCFTFQRGARMTVPVRTRHPMNSKIKNRKKSKISENVATSKMIKLCRCLQVFMPKNHSRSSTHEKDFSA